MSVLYDQANHAPGTSRLGWSNYGRQSAEKSGAQELIGGASKVT
jgi:hypothetical protein